jgi:hypothetical protein
VLRVGQLRFAWSPPEWVVATSLCQSAGRYPPPHGILKENLLWVRTFDTIEELRAASSSLPLATTKPGSSPVTAIVLQPRCEPTMDNELLYAKIAVMEGKRPLAHRRSRR